MPSVFSRIGKRIRRLVEAPVDRLLQGLAKAVVRVGFSFAPGRKQFESSSVDFAELMRAYQSDAYIMQAMDKHINLMFKAGWNLIGKNDKAVDYVRRRLRLMAVSTGEPVEQFFIGIAQDLVKYANVFLAKARVRGSYNFAGVTARPVSKRGVVGGYFRLHPSTITIQREVNGKITGYRQAVSGQTKDFAPEDIVHIYLNRESGMPFGFPFLQPVLEDVRLLRQLEENSALLVYRHIFPLIHYQVGLPQPGLGATDEEIEELRQEIANMPLDGALITPERHKIDAIRPEGLDAHPYLTYFENRAFSGLGVSQVSMGRGDTANRSTSDTMMAEMHDRIKAIQTAMSSFIDLYIINELLLEGGFNPFEKPEDDVDFVFNEIDLENMIKKHNFEIFKWTNNIQTFEETRRNIGHDSVVDESRLYFNMVQIPLAQVKAPPIDNAGAENLVKPANQHGTRSAPKIRKNSSEVSHDQFFALVNSERLTKRLQSYYASLRDDALAMIKNRRAAGDFDLPLNLAFQQMSAAMQHFVQGAFTQGMEKARLDAGASGPYPAHAVALGEVHQHAQVYLSRLQRDLRQIYELALGKPDANAAAALLAAAFENAGYRLRFMAHYELPLAYNYGYYRAGVHYGLSAFEVVIPKGSCEECRERADSFAMSVGNVLERIPPWHPFCGCQLRGKKAR